MPPSPANNYNNNAGHSSAVGAEQTRRVLRELRFVASANRSDQRGHAAALKERVCAEYPGGPDGYRYVPEHCVPIKGRRGDLAAAQLAAARSRTQQDLVAQVSIAKEKLQRLGAVQRGLLQHKFDLEHLPHFFAFAVPLFRRIIRKDAEGADAGPDAAYERVCDAWTQESSRETFRKNAACRAAVFALA